MTLYEVSAEFPGVGMEMKNVCCFDSRIVLSRLREEFGDHFESDFEDISYKDYNHFQSRIDQEGEIESLVSCRRTAKNDAMRRGPIFKFTIHWEGESYQGNSERYVVNLRSFDRPLPVNLRRRFKTFLEKLSLVPFEVRAVMSEPGNKITDLDG
jgi:hypothetical protein